MITCGRGGIGRRAALRSLWGNSRGSSCLLDRTIFKKFIKINDLDGYKLSLFTNLTTLARALDSSPAFISGLLYLNFRACHGTVFGEHLHAV